MSIGNGTIVRSTLGGLALVSSTTAACCFLTVWSYWNDELNADCPDAHDCECVLFGTNYASGTFVGGERFACRYVFCSTLASAALAACTCAFYGFKLLLCSPSGQGRRGRHRPVSSTRPTDTSPQITGAKICFASILVLMSLNMFMASIMLSNGYISTCVQYVHQVKRFLMVSGNMEELVTNRMSCGTIYDFLDYLQPPSHQVKYELIHRHKTNPRDFVINTSALLIVSILMSWMNTSIWVIFTFCIYYFE